MELEEIREILDLKKINETFSWIPNIEKVRELSRTGPGKFYAIKALHPMVTDRKNEGHGARRWTENEIMKASRTLTGKVANINHKIPITQGKNGVVDTEYNEKGDLLECLLYIEDQQIQKGIEEKKITKVSVQGKSRKAENICEGNMCAETPEGTIFEALALVTTSDFIYNGQLIPGTQPGDGRTTIEILETNEKPHPNCCRCAQEFETDELLKEHVKAKHPERFAEIYGTNNSSLTANSTPNKIMKTVAENLDAVVTAINGMDIAPEEKQKLIAAANQIYAPGAAPGETTTTTTPPPAAAPPATATPPTATPPTNNFVTLSDLEKKLTDFVGHTETKIKESLKPVLEDLFNKTFDQKFAALSKPGNPATSGLNTTTPPQTKSLEQLQPEELNKVLEVKLQTMPLQECLAVVFTKEK